MIGHYLLCGREVKRDMRHIKHFFLAYIIVLLCMLCACDKGGKNMGIRISPSDKSLTDLTSVVYEQSQLLDIAESNSSIDELNALYPIECLREIGGVYRASYLGDGSIAVILFDNSGNKIMGDIHDALLLKSDYSCLAKGHSLDNVREIDPNGEYLFLYTGRNDTPRVSTHYTKDGWLITIEYDDLNRIINIETELI